MYPKTKNNKLLLKEAFQVQGFVVVLAFINSIGYG